MSLVDLPKSKSRESSPPDSSGLNERQQRRSQALPNGALDITGVHDGVHASAACFFSAPLIVVLGTLCLLLCPANARGQLDPEQADRTQRMREYQFFSRATLKVDLREPPLGALTLNFFPVEVDGNGDTTIEMAEGPLTPGVPFDTRMTTLNLVARHDVLGNVYLQLRHDIITEGMVYNNDGGAPTTDRPADAQFKVFVDLDVPDAGMTINTGEHAVTMVSEGIRGLPPYGSTFHTIAERVPLYDTSDPTYEIGEVIDVFHMIDCGVSLPGPCNEQDDPGCGDSNCCTQNTCEVADGFPICVVNPAPAGHYPEGCGESQPGECNDADDEGCGDSDCCTNNECHCDDSGNALCVVVDAPPGTEGCGACCTESGCEESGEEECEGTFLADADCSETGACCMGDGSCTETIAECCEDQGGTFFEGDCSETGACCMGDGSCTETIEACCEEQGGKFFDGDCSETGACCMGDGSCTETIEACCEDQGGKFYDGDCSDTGACCMGDGSCTETIEPCCEDQGGTFYDADCSDTGACCMGDGSCTEAIKECCEEQGGTFYDADCSETGACCMSDGTCTESIKECCEEQGGSFYAGADCSSTGACCLPGGKCIEATSECCDEAGGSFYGQYSCEETGACCLPDGTCRDLPEPCCAEENGTYYGQYDCNQEYACCLPTGECVVTSYPCCEEQGGNWYEGELCRPEGACCVYGGGCFQTTEECCNDSGNYYAGDSVACEPNPCCSIELSSGETDLCVGEQTMYTAYGFLPGGTCNWSTNYTGTGEVSITPSGGDGCTATITGTAGSSAPNDIEVIVTYYPPAGNPCQTSFQMTVYDPDIDIDSDNNGTVNEADDPVEMNAPGKFIAMNHSDDDDDDWIDNLDFTGVPGDPDVQPMPMGNTVCDGQDDQWRLVYNPNRVFVHNAHTGGWTNLVTPNTWNPCPIPNSFWIQGLTASTARGDVTVTFEMDTDGDDAADCSDSLVVTVIQVDLDIDTDNTGACGATAPGRTLTEDVNETDDPDEPGRFVMVNDDYDEGHRDTAVTSCTLPFTTCERIPDNNDPDPISADGMSLETDDFVEFVPGINADDAAMLAGTEIRLKVAGGPGTIRVIAVDPAAAPPFAGQWMEVPFNTDIRANYLTQGGMFYGWTWYAEGMSPGEMELQLEFKFNNTVITDNVELAVTKFELLRQGAVETTLKDWPEVNGTPLLRSARYPFDNDDNVLVRFTSVPGLGNNYFSTNLTSDSDAGGVRVMLLESPAGVYSNTGAEAIRLAGASSGAAPKSIQVIEEEILTFAPRKENGQVEIFCEQDRMVDRLEGAGGGITSFYGAATGDQGQLVTHMWGNANFDNAGNQDVPATAAGSATLNTFIKNSGSNAAATLESDLLWISVHGCEEGNLFNDGGTLVLDPNIGAGGIAAGDWNGDLEWVTIAACLWLNQGVPCNGVPMGGGCYGWGGPPPGGNWGRQSWQPVSYRGPRSIHGQLGAWCILAGDLRNNVASFFTQLRNGTPYMQAYENGMELAGALQPWAVMWGGQLDYENDKLGEVRPDINGANFPTIRYANIVGIAGGVCGRQVADGDGAADQPEDIDAFAGVDLAPIANAAGVLESQLFVQAVLPDIDPGFVVKHRIETPGGVVHYSDGTNTMSITAATPLTKAQTIARANEWIATRLDAIGDELTLVDAYPIEAAEYDQLTGETTAATIGYLVDFEQRLGNVPHDGRFLRIRVLGDRITSVGLKLLNVVSADTPAGRLDVRQAFEDVRDLIGQRMNLLRNDKPVVREADLQYWSRLPRFEKLENRKLYEGRIAYHYVTVSGNDCDENRCSRVVFDTFVDAVTGELLEVRRR